METNFESLDIIITRMFFNGIYEMVNSEHHGTSYAFLFLLEMSLYFLALRRFGGI